MKRMLKHALCLVLAAVMLLAVCGCTGPGNETQPPQSQQETEKNLKLWWAYNTENLMQDLEYDYDRDSTLRFHGIKGDVESVQLMITPVQNVASFDFVMQDVKTENGDVIPAAAFDVLAEHYLEVTSSYNVDSYYGMYPDALVPIENFKLRHHNSIAAGNNQGIWINANIPADAAAGKYTGTGTLTLDDETYSIPIELTVYNAVMPEEVHAQSSFLIWYDYIGYGEGYSTPELMDTYYWFFADKRLSADIERIIENRSVYVYGEGDRRLPITDDGSGTHYAYCVMPIISEGDIIGCVASLMGENDSVARREKDTEIKLIRTAASFLGKQLES